MAWPNTALTSYVGGSTPYIKASDLNSFQSAINGIINATYSHKAVVVDGTGGNVVVPVTGTLKLSGTASGTTTPTTTVVWGVAYKEAMLFGGATVDSAGAFVAGYNVKSCTRVAAGHYEVVFNGAPTNVARCRGQVTPYFNAVCITSEVNTLALSGSDLKATVFTYDAAGVKADANFYIDVNGG